MVCNFKLICANYNSLYTTKDIQIKMKRKRLYNMYSIGWCSQLSSWLIFAIFGITVDLIVPIFFQKKKKNMRTMRAENRKSESCKQQCWNTNSSTFHILPMEFFPWFSISQTISDFPKKNCIIALLYGYIAISFNGITMESWLKCC